LNVSPKNKKRRNDLLLRLVGDSTELVGAAPTSRLQLSAENSTVALIGTIDACNNLGALRLAEEQFRNERKTIMPSTRVGDIEIAYDIEGDGEPVVMINGIGADRGAWWMQVPVLAEHFQVITFDNRDVGETGPGDNPRPYPMRQFADDIAGLLDVLNVDFAHIVGASMGGAIAQEFAINYLERTKSVTIVCSWAKTDPWMFELMSQWDGIFERQGSLAWNRTSWLWVFTHRWYQSPESLQALIEVATNAEHPQSQESNKRQSDAFKAHDALERLGTIAAPAHVIAGTEDIYTPPRYSMEIANAIPGAQLSVIEDVGHGMFWEATEEFNRLLLEFLQGVGQ